jgi:hypothetical protein
MREGQPPRQCPWHGPTVLRPVQVVPVGERRWDEYSEEVESLAEHIMVSTLWACWMSALRRWRRWQSTSWRARCGPAVGAIGTLCGCCGHVLRLLRVLLARVMGMLWALHAVRV